MIIYIKLVIWSGICEWGVHLQRTIREGMKQVVSWRSKKLKKDGSGLRLWDFAGHHCLYGQNQISATIQWICTVFSLWDDYDVFIMGGRQNPFLLLLHNCKTVGLLHARTCYLYTIFYLLEIICISRILQLSRWIIEFTFLFTYFQLLYDSLMSVFIRAKDHRRSSMQSLGLTRDSNARLRKFGTLYFYLSKERGVLRFKFKSSFN